MSSPSFAIGTEIAPPLHAASQSVAISPLPLSSIEDLLYAIESAGNSSKKIPMLRTTAVHLSKLFNLALDKLPIEALLDVGPSFDLYLREHHYSNNSVRSYCQNARRLLRKAQELGWQPDNQPIADAWEPVLAALKEVPWATNGIVRFAIRGGKQPADFGDADLEAWGQWMVRRGRKYVTVRGLKARFRRAVARAHLEHLLPRLDCHPERSDYRIRTCDMPEPLRTEVRTLIKWKLARFAKGRPQRQRLRAVSARQFEHVIERLYGYAANIAHCFNIEKLLDLVTEDIVASFVAWCLNERNTTAASILKLSHLYAAMRHHPDYKDQDFGWFASIFSELPEDPKSRRAERKAAKHLAYEVVCAIPDRIRGKRSHSKRPSWLVHDELLITWLVTLPWRQRNLRECRLGEPQIANLYFAELPPLVHIAKPKWVEEALGANPGQRFWQFHFREDQTKTGHAVRGIVPRALLPLLEDYLKNHRPTLVAGSDPGTLFLNRRGGALQGQDLTELVAQLTLQYAGRRVTPHLFRDIFAYAWLQAHSKDFLTLSKILWHKDIKTTLQVYGADFDESDGASRVDEWIESRSVQK